MSFADYIYSGLFALVGALIGGWMALLQIKESNRLQAQESSRLRKLAGLERLYLSLDSIAASHQVLSAQAAAYALHHVKLDSDKISRALLSECEFLVGMYVPDCAENYSTLKSLYAKAMVGNFETLQSGIEGDVKTSVAKVVDSMEITAEMAALIGKVKTRVVAVAESIEAK